MCVEVVDGERLSLVSVRIPKADHLPSQTFQARTTEAYGEIARILSERNSRRPVRFWNFIPDIHGVMGPGLDRYRVFNAGRYAAFEDWFGGRGSFDSCVATATGIGHDGTDLVIHVLADDQPGQHVNNPRQCAPYHYSDRHGPLPPCFARATVIQRDEPPTPLALIGGTASILGEESKHRKDVGGQTIETLENMLCLLRAASDVSGGVEAGWPSDNDGLWRCFRELRVYYLHPEHAGQVEALVRERWPHLDRIELLRADICRAELLVEIEGIAEPHPKHSS